jgi:hypothetical protein
LCNALEIRSELEEINVEMAEIVCLEEYGRKVPDKPLKSSSSVIVKNKTFTAISCLVLQRLV